MGPATGAEVSGKGSGAGRVEGISGDFCCVMGRGAEISGKGRNLELINTN